MLRLSTVFACAALCALVACGRAEAPSASSAPVQNTAALEPAFASASRAFNVPAGLLKAIAYVETHVSTTPGLKSVSGGHGTMMIVERAGWAKASRATALTGASLGRLELDPAANILGAAAVLRELGDETFARHRDLDPNALGDWYEAVSLYPGIDSAGPAADYAAQVFTTLEQGFDVNGLLLSPTASDWQRNAPHEAVQRVALGGSDYPAAVNFVASPNFDSGRSTYEFVVIHTMEGGYSGTESWFQNSASQVSAHYIVRSSDGQITQMVHDADTAWHVQCYNARALGIEHEGFVSDPTTWYTDAMYSESAKLTRWLVDKHNIPLDRTHIIGHYEVSAACNSNGHTDPGGGWNWTKYMGLVSGGVTTPSNGVLTGVIYTAGDTSQRVSGVTVTANGQTQTTAAAGTYTFNVPAGTYTVTATKSGFTQNMVSRTVTAGATIWGSMDIDPTTATGTLHGTVYAFNAASPSNMSVVLSGATVTVTPGAHTATTGADGAWSFALPAGTYTITANKTGYVQGTQTRMVTAGAQVLGSIGLSVTGSADQQPPSVVIGFPVDGAQLDISGIEVTGTASDDRGPLSSVMLSLNGAAATPVPVTNGAFDVQVKLAPGANTLEVSAVDAASNHATAHATATFNAGVSGIISSQTDSSPVTGATVGLYAAGSSAAVTTATSDAAGKYALTLTAVPADYKLVVHASGFASHVETVTVGDDKRVDVDVTMVPGTDTGSGLGTLTFNQPADGSTVNTDTIAVYGSVSGFELMSVTVNGFSGQTLGSGGFSATIPLTLGDNTITANAVGVDGETVSGTMHLTYAKPTGVSVGGGCSGCASTDGLALFGLIGLAGLFRRRSR